MSCEGTGLVAVENFTAKRTVGSISAYTTRDATVVPSINLDPEQRVIMMGTIHKRGNFNSDRVVLWKERNNIETPKIVKQQSRLILY